MNTQQALQLAFQHLNGGNLGAAAQLFNSVLQQEPQNFAALNGRGFVALHQNDLPQAQADLQASLSINPNQPFAHKMLGIVLGAMGQFDDAMQSFAAGLALDAKDPEVYFNRANFRFQAGQVQEALADLDMAVKLKGSYLEPRSNRANLLIQLGDYASAEKDLDYLVAKVTNNPDLWVALGLVRHKLGKHQGSMQCNERALRLVPNHPDALLNSSSAMHDQGEYPAALTWADKAVAATPQRAEVHYAKAQALMGMHHFEEAVAAYTLAIELNPNYAEAWMGRGLTHKSLRNLDESISDFEVALRFRPNNVDVLNNIGIIYTELSEFQLAIDSYKKALEVDSKSVVTYGNIGVSYSALRKFDLAIAAYESALKLDPLNYGVACNLSFALLAKGDYKRGLPLFEARWNKRSKPRSFSQPLWLGKEDLALKTILVHSEQGMGDTLQFCRYVDLLAPLCKSVILLVPKPLMDVCQTLKSKVCVVAELHVEFEFDFHCPLMSLPLALGTEVETIPASVPYLYAKTDRVTFWKERLSGIQGLKVGLVWNGGLRKDQPETWGVNSRRNIPLDRFQSLEVLGVQYLSLQKGDEAEAELNRLMQSTWKGPSIINCADDLNDYSDTAALIMNLDLVISVDTSVAHLAGALGKPVWILNRFDSCWRWFVDREDSPWYPTARIYNQPTHGDWNSVLGNVNSDLKKLMASHDCSLGK